MANEELWEQNIQNVLGEALDCFVEFGMKQTNISTIAKCANVSQREKLAIQNKCYALDIKPTIKE